MLFYKYNLESQLSKEANLYLEVYKYNPAVRLPPYIKISDSLPQSEKYEMLGITDGKYVLLDKDFKNHRSPELCNNPYNVGSNPHIFPYHANVFHHNKIHKK
ncbi:MAG: hypothetical protein Q9M89_04735 [Persephonella sp.]|nr:hypothetical protein [Persephonella sp.]